MDVRSGDRNMYSIEVKKTSTIGMLKRSGQDAGISRSSNYGNFDDRWRSGQKTEKCTASRLKKLRRSVFFANQCILSIPCRKDMVTYLLSIRAYCWSMVSVKKQKPLSVTWTTTIGQRYGPYQRGMYSQDVIMWFHRIAAVEGYTGKLTQWKSGCTRQKMSKMIRCGVQMVSDDRL